MEKEIQINSQYYQQQDYRTVVTTVNVQTCEPEPNVNLEFIVYNFWPFAFTFIYF